MNVVIYARFSSHSQTEQSIEGQLKVCYEYAESHNYTIVGEYIDRAQSGKFDNRADFQRMIADSDKHTFEGVLVYQLDRFARNRYDSAIYKAKLKKNGVRVMSAKENISDDASGILIEGVLDSLINATRKALVNPKDYEARSNIMWCATLGLNTITGLSKEQDWEVHMIEHQVGAYTDCAHGVGLAIVSIPYYKHIYKYGLDKFVRFAKKVWEVDTDSMTKEEAALAGIEKLADFIKEMGIPTTLREVGATEEMLPLIANSTVLGGGYKQIDAAEILEILKECY